MDNPRHDVWLLLDSRSYGGIETHVANLACALRRSGIKVAVVFTNHYGAHPLAARLSGHSIPFWYLNGGLIDLLRVLQNPPALLHTHGYKAGILGRVAARFLGVPVVSTFHAGEPGRGRVRVYEWLNRRTATWAPAIAVSPAIASSLPAPATVIGNFVEPQPAPDPSSARSIAFVGRLAHEKGADLFCQLASAMPELEFKAFGDGPLYRQLRQAYAGSVRFYGSVPDMSPYWEDIGLLCMPSRYEGLPLAALEAMARGIPVAAFAVGGLPSLIHPGESGWLAPAGDLLSLCRSLRAWAALGGAQKSTVSARAQATIVERHSPDAVLPQILAFYQRYYPQLRLQPDAAGRQQTGPRGQRLEHAS